MPNLNRVMLMGNLTRDPELRYTPNNTAVANIGLAINRRWRDQSGQQQEETTFVDCEAWGKTAETLNQYLKKGRPLFIEGRLRLDQWQDKEGQNRSRLKVVIDNFQFIDSRQGTGAGGDEEYSHSTGGPPSEGGGGSYSRPPAGRGGSPQNRSAPARQTAPPPDTHEPLPEDDIPF